jgi:hypothetical protein
MAGMCQSQLSLHRSFSLEDEKQIPRYGIHVAADDRMKPSRPRNGITPWPSQSFRIGHSKELYYASLPIPWRETFGG